MSYHNIDVNTDLQIPYKLIHIHQNLGDKFMNSTFEFRIRCLDGNQTEESIKYGGITASFDVILDSSSIKASIVSKVTVGNVYKFYKELKQAYEKLEGNAELKEYGAEPRTNITVTFEKNGKCSIKGYIREVDYMIDLGAYRGIDINIICDQSYFNDALWNFKVLFEELAKIQGVSNFQY